jgi:DNA repair exonuclease SbcCD ATPase subunit
MDHMKLTDELRQQLMEAAVWKNDEISARLDESAEVAEVEEAAETQEVVHPSGKKLKVTPTQALNRAKYAERGNAPGKRKGVEDDTEYEDGEDAEELEEAAHVCPLCVSQLDESIDEERILEHLNVVLGLVDRLSQLNEGDEDIESVIDETIAELLFADEEE